jgi:hypothetical protein
LENSPIFIGGIERSGTSLLYALLASHPKIAMTRRTNLWPYFYNRYGDLQVPENLDRCIEAMMKFRRLWVLKPDFSSLRREFWQGKPDYIRLFTLLWEQIAARQGKPRWGDKSLNTEKYADVIFQAYPDAKMLHILRDPRDRYASALKRWKKIRGGVGSGTAMWLASVRLAERNLAKYPGQYKIVRYETLAAYPEETSREVCDYLGEEFFPEMLTMKGAETFRDEGGNSSFEQHGAGTISTRSIGRYRSYLSREDIGFIQWSAGRKMSAYDYALDPAPLAGKNQLSFPLVTVPLNLVRMAAWNGREAMLDRSGREIPPDRILSDGVEAQV